MADPIQNLYLMLRSGLLVALVAGIPALILAWKKRPAPPEPTDTWPTRHHGGIIILAFFISMILPSMMHSLLVKTPLFPTLYGAEFLLVTPPEQEGDPLAEASSNVRHLWSSVLAFPWVLLFLRFFLKQQGEPLGVRWMSWQPDYVLAYGSWLLTTPLIFAIYLLIVTLMTSIWGQNPDQHPLTQMGPFGTWLSQVLLGLQVMVAGPILEEILFRGLIFRWLITKPDPVLEQISTKPPAPFIRTFLGMAIAFAISLSYHQTAILEAKTAAERAHHLAPAVFILLLIPLLLWKPAQGFLWRQMGRPEPLVWQGMVVSSAIFAALHAKVWPSPVPLFFLGLVLAAAAYRTRSILAPILIHSLFNALSAVFLWLGGAG